MQTANKLQTTLITTKFSMAHPTEMDNSAQQ